MYSTLIKTHTNRVLVKGICSVYKRMKLKVIDFQENEQCFKFNTASANWASFLRLVTEKPNLIKSC